MESTRETNTKLYDLEDRTFVFARDVRRAMNRVPKTLINQNDIQQVIRSSGCIGANYREANESLSKKDFLMRIKIAKKEAKETIYWLNLLASNETKPIQELVKLIDEATQLMKILGSITTKV